MTICIDLVAAARPNFMKVAPLYHALMRERAWCRVRLVHTGQHYDDNMSAAFLRDLGLPEPHVHLGVGSGTHAQQTAGVMVEYEKACAGARPHWVVVVGDVNSTLACALTASKLGIRIAHLEAGLRSRDRSMPEEVNRLLTDALADLLWTPSSDADENLTREGVPHEKIARVGNIMIDSLEMMRATIERAGMCGRIGVERRGYGLVTLHRPSNVDHDATLSATVELLTRLAARMPLVFPVHPRTRARLERANLWTRLAGVRGMRLIEPLAYVEFMNLVFNARYVLTDSGGLQEETTYLSIPCLTLRDTTERPITLTQGTNRLVRLDSTESVLDDLLAGRSSKSSVPELWDGQTADRVVATLKRVALHAID